MIVRIAAEGQYKLPDDVAEKLNQLDNDAVAAVEAGDEARFQQLFDEMIQLVQGNGEAVPDDELVESQVIIPPRDLTFAEAQGEFSGDGIIPD